MIKFKILMSRLTHWILSSSFEPFSLIFLSFETLQSCSSNQSYRLCSEVNGSSLPVWARLYSICLLSVLLLYVLSGFPSMYFILTPYHQYHPTYHRSWWTGTPPRAYKIQLNHLQKNSSFVDLILFLVVLII